jgi:mannan endo-1,4-beta-mannosidase
MWRVLKRRRTAAFSIGLLIGCGFVIADTRASTIYEAENATLFGTVVETGRSGFSGTGYVGIYDEEDAIQFSVTVPAPGLYPLTIGYSSPFGGDKWCNLRVNSGSAVGHGLAYTGNSFATYQAGAIELVAGVNAVRIEPNWTWFLIDYIAIGDLIERPPLEPVPPDLVNPGASAEARALMTYLAQRYGQQALSGQQTGYYEEIDYIYSYTGKLPAICGFDFLNAGDLDRALEWASYGGLVTFSWHWVAPAGGHFYTDLTNFDVTRAVTPGTSENQFILADIDRIAAKLQVLQDAGVPVLWRPLHEAEGGWFWWGANGPAPCVQLYHIMYDRLTNYHHIDNLLWVWTSYTSPASPSWYPGNQYVDIVGYDNYPEPGDYGAFATYFDGLRTITGGHKLITMSENGPIPDPDALLGGQVGWLYFNTWSGDFIMDGQINDGAHLYDVYNHDYVVTLDELPSDTIYGHAALAPPLPKPISYWLPAPMPRGYVAYEAEDGVLIGTETAHTVKGYLGTGYVTDFDSEGDAVEVSVYAPRSGLYPLKIRYASPSGDKWNELFVNSVSLGEEAFPAATRFTDADMGLILLRTGMNTIRIEKSWGWFEVDAFLVGGRAAPARAPKRRDGRH